MNKSTHTHISKFLSFVLRHKPDAISLKLDCHGWADIKELIEKANASGEIQALNIELLKEVVLSCNKKRFIFSDDNSKIRANQGHTVNIDLQLKETIPPETLYHGTAQRFLESIKQQGLLSAERHHVHLSTNTQTALEVGKRHGKPILLKIKALKMHHQGFKFFLSENNVWLTQSVPTKFIEYL